MLHIIDESKGLDMAAKYDLNQEVVVTSFQGYRKGVVTGITASTNEKGTVFLYTVEFFVKKNAAPKVKKCLEKHLYGTVKEALAALSAMEEEHTAG
jgi:hypothetical protein|uniref:Uncharacterized protein n=1 Tax=Podoviridae sp. ctz6O13 TaxID=2827757 RepID=A0A8S5TKS6_9CAUD|nr:MAG TPA: hypothetical protein [Podoviridae sp. ctz6O13]